MVEVGSLVYISMEKETVPHSGRGSESLPLDTMFLSSNRMVPDI